MQVGISGCTDTGDGVGSPSGSGGDSGRLTAASELQLKKQEDEEQEVWQYLDVRTGEEMAKGHLHNSLNVPYMFLTPQGKPCKLTHFFYLAKQPSTYKVIYHQINGQKIPFERNSLAYLYI